MSQLKFHCVNAEKMFSIKIQNDRSFFNLFIVKAVHNLEIKETIVVILSDPLWLENARFTFSKKPQKKIVSFQKQKYQYLTHS